MSAPLALDSTAGDPLFRRQHYTQARPKSQFEIFISRICFSDALVLPGADNSAGENQERFPLCNLAYSV